MRNIGFSSQPRAGGEDRQQKKIYRKHSRFLHKSLSRFNPCLVQPLTSRRENETNATHDECGTLGSARHGTPEVRTRRIELISSTLLYLTQTPVEGGPLSNINS